MSSKEQKAPMSHLASIIDAADLEWQEKARSQPFPDPNDWAQYVAIVVARAGYRKVT